MEIQLRKATIKDLQFLFDLRNEEAVRKVSFNSDPIGLETHKNWLEKKLAGNESVLLIAEEDSRPVAQVRFDWIDSREAEINVAVTERFRGRGYGSEILKKSSERFFSDFPDCGKIHAFIKSDNKASIRSFEKAGYKFQAKAGHKGQISVEMILTRPV